MMRPNAGKFLAAFLRQGGMPYLWDGKGLPQEAYNGRDCSGGVTAALLAAGGPDWRATHNCQKLWGVCNQVLAAEPGDLFIYGANKSPTHVMVAVAPNGNGKTWMVAGFAGGDHTTTTLERAIAQHARFQIWEDHTWMDNFMGSRELPWAAL